MKPRRLHNETITSMLIVRPGGSEMAPRPPPLARAPAKPWRASSCTVNVSSSLPARFREPPHFAQELRGARRLANQSCHVRLQGVPQLGLDTTERLGQRLVPVGGPQPA